jgi:hypothetical protein
MGRDNCQPEGTGTITRITAHQIEVLWEGESSRRYRRAQLHNLRHAPHTLAERDLHEVLQSPSLIAQRG